VKPTVILSHPIRGYSQGASFEGRNASHQMKELPIQDIKDFRDRHRIPVSDEEIEKDAHAMPYYHPGPDAPEIMYMQERRKKLGGYVPERRKKYHTLPLPPESTYKHARIGSGKQQIEIGRAHV